MQRSSCRIGSLIDEWGILQAIQMLISTFLLRFFGLSILAIMSYVIPWITERHFYEFVRASLT